MNNHLCLLQVPTIRHGKRPSLEAPKTKLVLQAPKITLVLPFYVAAFIFAFFLNVTLFPNPLTFFKGDGTGGGTFSLEFEGGVASSLPFSSGAAVVQASIETNLIGPTGSLGSSSVSLEEATSTRRSYLVTFPSDLGDVAMIVGYGDVGSVVSSVVVTEETRGSVQVGYAFAKTCSVVRATIVCNLPAIEGRKNERASYW